MPLRRVKQLPIRKNRRIKNRPLQIGYLSLNRRRTDIDPVPHFLYSRRMAKKAVLKETVAAPAQKPSALVDTRVIYCGDNLEQPEIN